MGRTVEGRSELAELADDSASSAHATITSSPRRARSMTERQMFLYASSGEAVEQLEHKMQDSLKNTNEFTLATTLTIRRRKRAPRDQTERHETRQSAARTPRSTGHAEHDST